MRFSVVFGIVWAAVVASPTELMSQQRCNAKEYVLVVDRFNAACSEQVWRQNAKRCLNAARAGAAFTRRTASCPNVWARQNSQENLENAELAIRNAQRHLAAEAANRRASQEARNAERRTARAERRNNDQWYNSVRDEWLRTSREMQEKHYQDEMFRIHQQQNRETLERIQQQRW